MAPWNSDSILLITEDDMILGESSCVKGKRIKKKRDKEQQENASFE